jgi:hypothetical protein
MTLAEILERHRRRSRGPIHDPITMPYPKIFVGDAFRLTPLFLKAFRISHVINCADHSVCPLRIHPDRYACIGAEDSDKVHIYDQWYPAFKEAMDRFLSSPICTNVYVHCHAGMNRSAFLAAGYIVRTFGMPAEMCVERMVSQRPCVMTNPTFLAQLEEFVKKSA